MKIMIKPKLIKEPQFFNSDDFSSLEALNDLIKLFRKMGYFVFEDPTDERLFIISPKVITYGEYRKKYNANDQWWDTVTDFNKLAKKSLANSSW
jgi:hypothetical protein